MIFDLRGDARKSKPLAASRKKTRQYAPEAPAGSGKSVSHRFS
jgi:hypothetical protein